MPIRFLALAVVVLAGEAAAAPWSSLGPDGGVIRRILIDPSTPSTLYLSTDRSVYKSVDGSVTWDPQGAGLPPGILAYRLAIDPTNPATLYAGLFPGPGVARSTNGGASWALLPGSPSFPRALDVDGAGTVYVGTPGGVSRSSDGGTTWADTTLGGSVESLAVDPTVAGTLYAATFSNIYRSTDSGATFTPAAPSVLDITALAVDPTEPSTVYATGIAFPPLANAYKSTDAGATWTALSGLPAFLNASEAPIGIDPTAAGTVYIGGLSGPYKTTNGGNSFTLLAAGIPNPRVDAFAVHPSTGGRLWTGTWSGVYESTDGAASWVPRNTGIRELSVTSIVVDAANPSTLYVASADGGFFRSSDSGASWAPVNAGLTAAQRRVDQMVGAPVGSVLFARVNDGQDLVRSYDGGTSWAITGLDIPTAATRLALAVDPNATGTLYVGIEAQEVGGISGLYRSIDGATSFSPLGGFVDRDVAAVAVAPSSGRIYAADFLAILRSDDDGASAVQVGVVPAGVTALAVDPADADVVLAGTEDRVYRSTNGGVTWTAAAGTSRFVSTVAFDSLIPGFALAATELGVLASTDGGVTWTAIGAGLTTVGAKAVAFEGIMPGRIYAGMEQGSAWRRDLAGCENDADCEDPDLCTADACLPGDSASDAFGCVHTPVVCPAAPECKAGVGVCAPSTGICQYANRPNGTPCTSDGSGCTTDSCQGGACTHAAQLVLSCRTPGAPASSQLVFKQPSPEKARLTWSWKRGDVSLGELGDPLTDGATDWELCLFDHGGPGGDVRFLTAMRAPAGGMCAGRPCWTIKGVSFKYGDKDRTPNGTATMLLRSGASGAGSLKAVGKGVNLALPTTALVPGVTAQLRRDDDPLTCWQSIFTDGIKTNVPGSFKAKAQ